MIMASDQIFKGPDIYNSDSSPYIPPVTLSSNIRGGGVVRASNNVAIICDANNCNTLTGTSARTHNLGHGQYSHCSAVGAHDGETGLFLFGGGTMPNNVSGELINGRECGRQ